MFFLLSDVHAGSKEEYLTNKIGRSVQSVFGKGELPEENFVENQVKALMSAETPLMLPIVNEEEFYEIDQGQETVVDVAKQCALMDLVRTAPLIKDEEIVEDFFTYLKEPFGDFPSGTGLLRRRTNMAEWFYIFDHVRIEDGNVIYREGSQTEVIDDAEDVTGVSDKVGEIVKDLLSKAAGAAGGKIGALIFNLVIKEIFGSDDNKALINEIQKVIKDEIQSNEIDKINARVQGTIQYLTNEYQVRKKDSDLSNKEERKELLESLNQYSQSFYSDVMGVLEQPAYAEKGLKSYLVGSSIHLIITQEQALVDWKTMDPNASSYAETLKINAKHYREHIETTYNPMLKKRLDKISWKHDPDYICDRIGCHVNRDAWSWGDSEAHKGKKFYNDQHKKGPSAKELAERAANNQKAAVKSKMAENAGDPEVNALPSLKKLETMRIPQEEKS